MKIKYFILTIELLLAAIMIIDALQRYLNQRFLRAAGDYKIKMTDEQLLACISAITDSPFSHYRYSVAYSFCLIAIAAAIPWKRIAKMKTPVSVIYPKKSVYEGKTGQS